MTSLPFLAVVVVLAAALRSTWSPCGLSMLSSITPLAERGRGRRFSWTASWFVAGSVTGGLVLGACAALPAALVGAAGWSPAQALAVAAVAALVTAAFDAGALPPAIPHHRRQVDDRWLDNFRGWVYGFGFGAQIGVGVATYIMTAAVYLVVVLAALTASPVAALALGGLFGLARGFAIFLGAGCTSPAALLSFHRRFDALAEPVRLAVTGLQLVVAVVAAWGAWGAAPMTALVAVAATALGAVAIRERTPVACPTAPTAEVAARAGRHDGQAAVRA